jgi:MYXO-CTERM domain-containing protein
MTRYPRCLCTWLAVGTWAALGSLAQAMPLTFTIDTSALAGTSAQLAFDLIDGGSPANTILVSGFSTDGVLGASSASGDTSGALPGALMLGDGSFFNEYLQSIVLGTTLAFTLSSSDFPPDAASSPDAFAFFFLDAAGAPLFATADPTGADALIGHDFGASRYQVHAAAPVSVVVDGLLVPEPGSWLLALTGLLAALAVRQRREPLDGARASHVRLGTAA